MKKKTVSNKLILGGLTAVLVPFLIAGIIIYFQLSDSLMDLSKKNTLHMAQDIAKGLDERLTQEIKFASSIAADPDIINDLKSGTFNAVQSKLETIYKRIGEKYFTLFVTDKNGFVRADAFFKNQAGLDLSDREYFIKAKAEGKTSVAGPLTSRGVSFGSPIIVVSVPIHDENEFYGIVAIVFSSDFFKNIIFQHNIGLGGLAFVIDDKGIVLAHPQKELILRLSLFEQPGTEEIRQLVVGKRDGIATYSYEGSDNIAGLFRMKLTPWTVAYAMKKDEIIHPMMDIIYSIFFSGVIFLLFAILSFILFSKRFSKPIQNMLELQKQMTQHSTETILQIGLDKKIIYANPAFEKVTGLNAETIIGSEPCLDNLKNLASAAIWESLQSGKPWSGRVMFKGDRPEPVILDVMIIPLRDDLGMVQSYLQIGRDITTELMFEKRLQQSQKLEAVGTLAGGIAHDFNNILSGIFGYADLALLKNDSIEETRKYIKQIKVASERARDLVSQILTFSRNTDIEIRPLVPKTTLKEAIKLLRASIPANVDIRFNMVSNSMIKAEPTQLHQIAINLVTNAAYAMGDQGGTITLELEDIFVEEEFTKTHPDVQPGKHVKIRVSDTGCGIQQDILDRIFEPFFTTKSHGQGTGLGLSVVHGIVKKLGGIITVYSELGKGTVFNIIIPCTETDTAKWNQREYSLRKGSERLLIIDDEPTITASLQVILESIGYTVTVFTDSTEALKAVEQNPHDIDIIISDYSMPQMSGLEVAEKLREAGINIPTILTSGFLEDNIKERAQCLGITEFIAKPMSSYQITDAICRMLDS